MPEAPILAILFDGAGGEAALTALRRRHPGAPLVLLTTADAAPRLAAFADEVWTEAVPRGPARFLALMRRIAWMRVGHIYDFEDSAATRLMRLCVWPRPHWHGREALERG